MLSKILTGIKSQLDYSKQEWDFSAQKLTNKEKPKCDLGVLKST